MVSPSASYTQDLEFRSKLDRLVKAGKIQLALDLGDLRKLDTTDLGTCSLP